MPRSTHLAAPVALGGCEGRPIWPASGTDWLPSVDVHEQSISLGVSLFRTRRLPLTTHTSRGAVLGCLPAGPRPCGWSCAGSDPGPLRVARWRSALDPAHPGADAVRASGGRW